MSEDTPVLAGDDAGVPDLPPKAPVEIEISADGHTTINLGGGQATKRRKRTRFDDNLAEDLGDDVCNEIGETLLRQIESDLGARADWEETVNKAIKFLGTKIEDPAATVSADGTVSKQVATCLLEACIKLWSIARAELLPVGGPVKVRRDADPQPQPGQDVTAGGGQGEGLDTGGLGPGAGIGHNGGPPMDPAQQSGLTRDQLADALQTDFNHYLTVTDRGYYPDTSKMLFNRAMVGVQWKKVHRCPIKQRPVSVWVRAQDLIVSNDASHLSEAGRVTERIRMRQSVMRRMMASGHYRDIMLSLPTPDPTKTELAIAENEGISVIQDNPEDYTHLVYECYCELGSGTVYRMGGAAGELDRDERGRKPGFPLPYRVSIDTTSRKVLEIRRNWKQGDRRYEARRRYVKYGFVPGVGFYDYGLIHIVGNPTLGATMLQRAGVDTTLFANFPGGVMLRGPGSKQTNTVIRPNPGEFIPIDGGEAGDVNKIIKEMPYRDMSQEAMALLMKQESDARRLAGIIELPVGEGRIGNTPVGTIMAYIDSVSQVPGAVHKDDHISQQEEFELMRELFAEDPPSLWRGRRRPANKWQVADEILDPDLVPAADPNTPSSVHRLMKSQGLVLLSGQMQFQGISDNRAIYRKAIQVLAGDDGESYELPQQPPQPAPPDPRIQAAQIKAQSQQESDQARLAKANLDHTDRMTELAEEGKQREADRESAEVRAAMGEETARMKNQHDAASDSADRALDHAHHTDEMAAQQQQMNQQQTQHEDQQLSAAMSGGQGEGT